MPDRDDIFRREAIEASANQGAHQQRALLQLIPGWTGPTYWFLALTVVVALSYSVVASVPEYAEGPAVVRIDSRLDLTAPSGGSVTGVDVQQGQHVKAGQMLVRFFGGAEQRELDRVNREFELKLVRVLQDPSNEAIRQSLATLRAERELMEAKLADRAVLAPADGVVINLRVRVGQAINPGEVVMTLIDEKPSAFSVIALVPGKYRPMLTPGMPLRLELDGYPYLYQSLDVESVGSEAIGPTEVRRYLGEELGDSVAVQGSMVVVHARLPKGSFTFENQQYNYYDGIPGHVDVKVRATRVLLMLFPALRKLVSDDA